MKASPLALLAVLLTQLAGAAPIVINDEELLAKMRDQLSDLAKQHQATDGKTLAEALKKAPAKFPVVLPANLPATHAYSDLVKSVFIVASAYKCEACHEWHNGGVASAWCLTADGVMVTNRHVFESPEDESWGVCGVDGKVHKILRILATNEDTDAALFQVETNGTPFVPLKTGGDADVGERVRILSHPGERFFFQSSGEISRYSTDKAIDNDGQSLWMSVTADFAEGSSGGPVFNADGAVVGMVSNTEAINHEPAVDESAPGPEDADPKEPGKAAPPSKDPKAKDKEKEKDKPASKDDPASTPDVREQQMTIKNCVPISRILDLIAKPDSKEATPKKQ